MGILTKEVEVVPTGKMIKYYRDKGYDSCHLKSIMVKVEDLPEHSDKEVDVLCDYCKENIVQMKYSDYKKGMKNIEKYSCVNCRYEKIKEVTKKLYGTEYVGSLPDVKEKREKTLLNQYGVENYSKTKEWKEKVKETSLIKYGFDNPSKSPVVFEKRKNTNLLKFGCEYNLQSTEVRKQIEKTCLSKYGCTNVSQSNEIQERKSKTFYKNDTCPTSKQQRYLHKIYNGELNYPLKMYNLDIYLKDENIDIEYDGSGHWLSYKCGNITEEEFYRKEIIRNSTIKKAGIKQMRIISTKDYLPSDTILLQMLTHTKEYFSKYPNHSWIEYNIDTSTVRNAEQKEGVFFDFGELRKIKEIA